MSATDAEKFLDKMENDPQFREAMEAADSWDETWEIARRAGLTFTEEELQALVMARATEAGLDEDASAGWSPGAHW